jgi:DNA polymerase-3 subunit gamma/tau
MDALEILARSGSGSLRDTLTLLDQAIIYSKSHVDVSTVTDMLGLVDPKFLSELFDAIFEKDYEKLIEYTKILEDYESEMVVDELIAYLKEKMYNQDAMFSTLVLDRFFRILSDAKYLFSINADGSFVLSLIFFKMIEALKIREIDQMIESFEQDLKEYTPAPSIKIHSTTPEMSGKIQAKETKKVEIAEDIAPLTPIIKEDIYLEKFNTLVAKITDRNYELGECFTKNINFVSYENDILTWESCADEECKKSLKHGYSVIKQLVREIFSFETSIKGVACSKPQQQVEEQQEQPQDNQQNTQIMQSASTVADIEVGGGASCVTGCDKVSLEDEINGTDITKEPMVEKAIELFEAKKVIIQSKI